MKLEELKIYQSAMEIAELIYDKVYAWDYFSKDTIGKQLIRSVDSVAANISEGFGRYHFKETLHFGYISRGSLYESKTWLKKAYSRKLIEEQLFAMINVKLEDLGVRLNNYLNAIRNSSRQFAYK